MLLSVVHVSNPGILNSPENQIACRLSRAPAFEKPVIRRSIIKKPTEKLLLLNFFRRSSQLACSTACLNPIFKDASYPTNPFYYQSQNQNECCVPHPFEERPVLFLTSCE
jgi:hypothetical protein